ncbi:outer membrane beta-barrel protein [Pontibacter oryzae]|uniref:Outer membrane protein beta-barrel domain-containing protein n=1 Tax=Pontibacter oryzae TaxID=2304593 RepID=A0A399RT59_9BACT|nr:outer membrane beta-barrel protein [Pontibacter oryzae]RIJ34278.1 hypothetical protein D1627_15250 [Pontibacter oryzae]
MMQKACSAVWLILLVLVAYTIPAKAQEQRNKGYIGLGLGPSFLPGNKDVKTGAGLHLNLLNVGYSFGKGFGVTGTWVGGAHAFDSEAMVYNQGHTYALPTRVEVSYGVLMVGPMYTSNVSDDSSIDVKFRLGSLYTSEKSTSEVSEYVSENRTLGISLGVGYRRKIANRWCVMLSSDYYTGNQQFSFATSLNTHILSFTTGIGFVL